MTAEPTTKPLSLEARVALAMGWTQDWIDHTGQHSADDPPPITAEVAMGMLREMGQDTLGDIMISGCPGQWAAWMTFGGAEGEGDTLEHAIAECWLQWRAAQEVRE